MGFFKKLAKPLAQIGASFIPGVGPALSAGIGAIGGAAGDAWANSGNQGGTSFNQTQTMNQNMNYDGTETIDQFNEAVEDPQFKQMRNGLIPTMQNMIQQGQAPIYGDAQKAKYLSDLNDLADSSMRSLQGGMSRLGRTNSGAGGQALQNIEGERFGKAADFFGQLPFMESQAKNERMLGLMGLATNWAGRSPISQKLTGTNTKKGSQTTTGTTTTEGQQTQQGGGFWKNLAGNMGGLAGDVLGQQMDQGGPMKNFLPPNVWKKPGQVQYVPTPTLNPGVNLNGPTPMGVGGNVQLPKWNG